MERDSNSRPLNFAGEGRFFAFMSQTIRRKLVDRIIEGNAIKNCGGKAAASLEGDDVPSDRRTLDYLDLRWTEEELRGSNERLWQVAENKFSACMTNAEVARGLALSKGLACTTTWRRR